uniref:Uncharacterized protein ycf23 n=1 Tax=Laurencieae sp. TaxID=2007162 RepID=A0A1Z1M2W4_9FLOR|nr:hypothetical protein [Laurencieae sp.]
MNLFSTKLYSCFQSKRVIKVITGMDNTSISKIINIAKVAELSGGSYLDIVANPKLVKLLKSYSSIPICVSSISPIDLYNCAVAGADLIEVGNFDSCYKKGIYMSSCEISQLCRELRSLMDNIDLCVTIPYYLPLSEQIKLAQDLEFMGVNIIQTEAFFIKNKLHRLNLNHSHIFQSTSLSYLSLLSTYFISEHVRIPVITSSSINAFSSPMALLCGASGVGVGSVVQNQYDLLQMSNYVKALRYSINSLTHEQSLNLNYQFFASSSLNFNIISNLS